MTVKEIVRDDAKADALKTPERRRKIRSEVLKREFRIKSISSGELV